MSFFKNSRLLLAITSGLRFFSAFGCHKTGNSESPSDSSQGNHPNGERQPISICAPGRSVKDFIDVVHQKYPEIVFEVDPYSGQNATVYRQNQLKSGEMPDIYSVSYYIANQMDVSDKLRDLSGYSFTNNYVSSRLREVNENGAIYLLPSYYSCRGITYNKKILADNGWTLPKSFQELKELAPKVKSKGYNLALNEIGLPGYGFQFRCNILDTDFLSTLDGRKWQSDFLSGKASFKSSPERMESLKVLDEWRDIGRLNGDQKDISDGEVCKRMAEGNTLFLLGNTNAIGSYGGNIEDFGLRPYLSMDGTQNVYIRQVSRYRGLNKKLQEKGNEQKLEDALHVREVLSTKEGREALNKSFISTNISPLKDAHRVEGNFYNDIRDEINAGFTAPFIYSGWDNVIPSYGNERISYICGEKELAEVVDYRDDNQSRITSPVKSYTTVTETISTKGCAKLTGIAFAKASGSDVALRSLGGMDRVGGGTNGDGINGKLFPLPVTEAEVCSIVPTGWHGNVQTVTFTGKRLKEIAKEGYDRKDRGYYYPYLLITKDGREIEDSRTYKIAICGRTEKYREEGNVQDSGILGLTAVEDYLSGFATLKESDIRWN